MVPKNLMKLEGKNAAAMLRLSEALEEHDDVQNVYSNFDIDEKGDGGLGLTAIAYETSCAFWASIAELSAPAMASSIATAAAPYRRRRRASDDHSKQPLEARLLVIATRSPRK